MELTHEQKQIIEEIGKVDRLKIFAYAGTGKTTTLREIAKHYKKKRILYLAFNSSVVEEAKEKFPENTEIRTTHSLALKYFTEYFRRKGLGFPKIKDIKPMEIIEMQLLEKTLKDTAEKVFVEDRVVKFNISRDVASGQFATKLEETNLKYRIKSASFVVAKIVKEIFDEFCFSAEQELSDEFIEKTLNASNKLSEMFYSLKNIEYLPLGELKEIIKKHTKMLWYDMEKGNIPISHNFYLKFFELYLGNLFIVDNYDIVLLDEAQDTNDVTLSIFEKIPAKKVMVGDIHQKIYGFRKSINAMEKWRADRELRLTISFRFPEEIAKEANKIIVGLKRERYPLVSYLDKVDNEFKDVCYITRTNARLIEIAAALLDKKELFRFIRKPKEVFRTPLSVLYLNLYLVYGDKSAKEKIIDKSLLKFKDFESLKDYADRTDDVELKSAISIVEKYGEELEIIFQEVVKLQKKKNATIFLTTAHSAKGLEWDKVIIEDDFPDLVEKISDKYSNLEQLFEAYQHREPFALEMIEEMNLYYVAITRAKKVLIDRTVMKNYIDEGYDFINNSILEKYRKKAQMLV